MKRAIDGLVLVGAVAALLVVTGVIDETWVLLSVFGMADPGASETARGALEAFMRGDLKALVTLGGPFARPLSIAYALRSVAYLAGGVLLVVWALPKLRRAFESLRRLDAIEPVVSQHELTPEARQADSVRALRARAARKRVESYAFLAAALASLAIAVGFVTRETPWTHPQALGPDTTSPAEALRQAQDMLVEGRRDADERLTQNRTSVGDLVALVREQLLQLEADQRSEHAAARERIVAALLARQATAPAAVADGSTEVAREYLAFARAQLEVANRQAELEALRTTSVEVIAKLAAVVLILALARVLVRLYQRGLGLSVQYEAIADAVQLGRFDPQADPAALRELYTPRDATVEADLKPSKELVGVIDRIVAALAPLRGGR